MDFIKMIMELPGEKRSQDVVEHTEWNSLWKLIVTQGNHSENYLEQLYDYFFNKEEGWVHKVQAELDGVQPYVEGAMTQPVGKAPDGSLWTYPSTESGTVPWGNVMGDITKQQDLIQKFNAKSDVGHGHDINTLTFTEGDIDGSWIIDGTIGESAYGSKSIPTSAFKDLSVTSEKLSNGAVTTAKIASSAVINDSIANGSVSGAKIADGAITRAKLAQDALVSPFKFFYGNSYTITAEDIGYTIMNAYTSGDNNEKTVNLTYEVSHAFPIGTILIVARTESNPVKISFGENIQVGISGNDNWIASPTVNISNRFSTVALMLKSAGAKDYWILTGETEVVT